MAARTSLLAAVLAVCAGGIVWGQPSKLQEYLRKPGFQWKCEAQAGYDLCHPRSLWDSDVLIAEVNHALAETLRQAGVSRYSPRIHFFAVESYSRMRQLVGAYAAGSSEPAEHIVCFAVGHPEALTHELNHEVMTHLWGRSEPWLAEGLAAYVTDPDTVDHEMRLLIVRHNDLPLERMVNSRWTASTYPSTVIYPELGSFVKFLKTRYGMERLHLAWSGGSASLRRVYGKSLADLEREWRDSLKKQ